MRELTKKQITKDVVEFSFQVPSSKADEITQLISDYLKSDEEESDPDFVPWRNVYSDFDAATALRGGRVKEGLTQAGLSEITGIPRKHISEMENRKRPVTKEAARMLAEALNVSHKVFLTS